MLPLWIAAAAHASAVPAPPPPSTSPTAEDARARGLVLPRLPEPRLHREVLRPAGPFFAPAPRTWDPVDLVASPDLVHDLLAGAVSLSIQSWAQEYDERRTSILAQPPSFDPPKP